jgi:DUF971 family protein
MTSSSWPLELRVSADKQFLTISFDDHQTITLSAKLLRIESPSAEVQGHHPSMKKIITGKEDVKIIGLEPQGHYAIKILFDDGHDTGIYRWQYFKDLAPHAFIS